MKDNRPPGKAPHRPRYQIGTSGWTYDDWKDTFYPPDLPKKRWFEYYASLFSTVEVNATFYRTFKDETYQNWERRAPAGFGYVLKAPRVITHRKYLTDVEEDIRTFYRSCTLLGDKFELILLQVAPNMPYEPVRLQAALQAFPDPTRVAVEFRRPEWLNPQVFNLLETLGTTICNVDSPQHTLTDFLTSEYAYLRMHGRRRWYDDSYSATELEEIAAIARNLADKGASRLYIYFNNDYHAIGPANALALRVLLEGE